MCKRRKRTRKRKPKPKRTNKEKKDINKKRLTCCQRCRRRIRKWCCRRMKRCIKRTIFDYTDPQLDDFEIAGYNLGSVRDKFRDKKVSIKKSKEIVTEKKDTVLTLYRKHKFNKSMKSIPMKDIIGNEVDRYSFSKSTGKKLLSYLNDFKERNLYLGLSKDSQLNLNASEKERFKKLADDYEQKNKKYSIKDFLKNIDVLKKRFSLTLSKGVILKNIVDDYKNKKYSFTGVIDTSKYYKSNFDINDFEKKDLDKIISHYKAQKKSKIKFLDKKLSIRDLEIMYNIDSDGLKKKYSLTKSRQILLKNMIEDNKNDKFKLSAVPDHFKVDMKKIDKENLNKILDYYKKCREKKRFAFIKQSRVKQMKSDLMAKLNYLKIG